VTVSFGEPRYPKPKILLVDLPDEATADLDAAGFNVQAGTFGRPYRVPAKDDYFPVIVQAHLPNYTEQEVVVIDLIPPKPSAEPVGTKSAAKGEQDWYARTGRGLIDPRPRAMALVNDNWGRILASGGVFTVFAQPRLRQDFVLGVYRFGMLDHKRPIVCDNWSFLNILSPENLRVEADHGTESQVCESVDLLENFLRGHQPGVEFSAVLTPTFTMTQEGFQFDFLPLMSNKFGETVGGIVLAKRPKKGRIVILPQVKDKVRAVRELVTTVLPELCRHLFPYFEGDRWVHSEKYEHASVLEKKGMQQRVREEADARLGALDLEIKAEAERLRFLHGVLTKTGDELVDDLREALRLVGFNKIEKPAEEEGVNRQEDLQIHDRSPCLLLEVKGLAALPTEGDALQGTKYVIRRMKQWQRTDVSGVFVVNHQRNLPALYREHGHVFTQQQLDDAAENGMGLTTTWDLFRMIRGLMQWSWPPGTVQDVLYGTGRLPSVPSHYTAAGTVAHYYSDISVLSIDVNGPGLRVGDTVGFLFPSGFFQETVNSLQVNKEDVRQAAPGQRAGYKTTLTRNEVPVGTPIYVVGSWGTERAQGEPGK
jgi:hypothetical protein